MERIIIDVEERNGVWQPVGRLGNLTRTIQKFEIFKKMHILLYAILLFAFFYAMTIFISRYISGYAAIYATLKAFLMYFCCSLLHWKICMDTHASFNWKRVMKLCVTFTALSAIIIYFKHSHSRSDLLLGLYVVYMLVVMPLNSFSFKLRRG